MSAHYTDATVTLHHGDCLDVLATLPDASVDAVCTDPPYGLANTDPAHVAETITRWVNGERDYLPGGAGFMGKAWDAFVPPVAVWDECLRVLKPGGHVLSFAGSRTVDLMTLGLRLAGFDIRDSVAWLYGSGFPKSLDVSKAIDRDNGRKFEDRFALGRHIRQQRESLGFTRANVNEWLGAATKAEHYESESPGFARVPTLADWHILRERLGLSDEHLPLVERVEAEREKVGSGKSGAASVAFVRDAAGAYDITAPATPDAARWQGWGTALKPAFEPVVVARKPLVGTVAGNVLAHGTGALNIDGCRVGDGGQLKWATPRGMGSPDSFADDAWTQAQGRPHAEATASAVGRWPANVVLDESQAAALDEQSGELHTQATNNSDRSQVVGDTPFGGAKRERVHYGLEPNAGASRFFYVAKAGADERVRVNGTAHPTVKPLALMRWLVRLVTPPGGTILEPFAGSGTTVEACILEGFRCVAIEREADYLPLIVQRINRRRDPVEAVRGSGEDGGLFDLLGGTA